MLEVMKLSRLQQPLNGRLIHGDVTFDSVSIDSRNIIPGQLFVALSGPRFDGHDYAVSAVQQGAGGVMAEHEIDGDFGQLIVTDTRKALGQMGRINRQAFQGRVAAVTGSSGKTTVKEMLASILRQQAVGDHRVLATQGNLNNELGVPLTLLQLSAQHAAAVIELGASHMGEIAYTVELAQPHVAVITNAGTAHVGEFGGPDEIIEAKGEILEGLAADGTAVLNKDDPAFERWVARASGRAVVTFSTRDASADFFVESIERDHSGHVSFVLKSVAGTANVQLGLIGEHNVHNALAAAAAAHAMKTTLPQIVSGLRRVQPVRGRGVSMTMSHGQRVIDDTYNANPASIMAATDVLAGFAGRTVLVLGDMGEMGDWAEQAHRQVGVYAAAKVDALYAVGPLMAFAVDAFGPGARHFDSQAQLIAALTSERQPNTTVLVKGSRSAAMEKVVAALCDLHGETN